MKPYPYAWINSWNIHFNWFYFISPRHPFLSLPAWTRRMGWRIAGKASNTTAGDEYVAGEATQGFALSTNQAKQANKDGSSCCWGLSRGWESFIWGFTSETRKRVLPYARNNNKNRLSQLAVADRASLHLAFDLRSYACCRPLHHKQNTSFRPDRRKN